jgi:hypothetical protein
VAEAKAVAARAQEAELMQILEVKANADALAAQATT